MPLALPWLRCSYPAAAHHPRASRRLSRTGTSTAAGCRATSGRVATWQSLRRGTGAIETDYLTGEIVLLGRLHGVATPANEALQALAAEMARAGEPPASRTVDDVLRTIAGA